MKREQKVLLFVAGVAIVGLLVGGGFLSAKDRMAKSRTPTVDPSTTSFTWGLERLGAEPNLSPDKKADLRGLISNGGLFFNTNELRDVISAGSCGGDCDWCCCDAQGNNCHCCE